MKIIRVKKKDISSEELGEIYSTFYEYKEKYVKWFGIIKAFFVLDYNNRKVISYIQGPIQSPSFDAKIPMEVSKAKGDMKEMEKNLEDYKKAISYAEKTGKELQTKLNEMLKGK